MNKATYLLIALWILLIGTTPLHAQDLLKDIWPGGESSAPKEFAYVNGVVYFAAEDASTGIELWRTDGTAGGTWLVKDINPTGSSDPSWMAGAGGKVFFRANDGVHGDEVWVSDGTAAGTHLTLDIWPGFEGAHPEHIAGLGGWAYFMAGNPDYGSELWRSNGTTTELVMDINPGVASSEPHWPVVLGSNIFFRANDGAHGEELWMTDGTTTQMVYDINPGSNGSHPERLVVMGGAVYFPAEDGLHGAELWRSNGTTTELVADIYPGGSGAEPKEITVVGNQLFFAAEDGVHGSELWRSDGSVGGTVLVRDIRSGDAPSLPGNLTAVGNTLFFSATAGMQDGTALWKSDGSEAGTVLVKDVRNSGEPAMQFFTAVGKYLVFTANDGAHGVELWRSDGTERGTFLLKDISRGHASSAPLSLTTANGVLYFSASDGLHGRELWSYNPNIPPEKPTAQDDEATTAQNIPVNIDVLVNDLGAGLQIIDVADPPNGSVVLEPNHTLTYTPDTDFTGEDAFVYTVEDINGNTDFATVTVTVTPTNTPPTIDPIADQQTNEDTLLEEVHFTIDDEETSPTQLVVTASSDNQTLVPDANIALEAGGPNRSLTIMPALDQYGTATITVTVSDGEDDASTSFLLTVHPVNDPPVVHPIADQTTDEDTPIGPIAFTVDDVDNDAAVLVVTATSGNQTLLPDANIILGGSGTDRTITLTPAPDQAGEAIVTVTASDGTTQGATTFLLTVLPVDAPTISAIPDQVTPIDTPIGPIAFTVDDAQTDPTDLLVTATSNNQTLLPDANIALGGSGTDRTLTLTPAANQIGTATVAVVVEDGDGNQTNTAFILTVIPTGAPFAADDLYIVTPGEVLMVDAASGVLANDTDPNGDPLTAILVEAPEHGTLILNADGSFSYTPAEHSGEETTVFSYQASDGVYLSNMATVTLDLRGPNTPPTISDIPDQETDEDVPVEITGIIVEDAESHGDGLIVTATSSNQALVRDEDIVIHGGGRNRNVNLDLVRHAFGTATITVTVSDGELEDSASFLLTVHSVNDVPTISEVVDQETNENTPLGPLPFTVGDVESDPGTLVVTAASNNPALLPNGNITLGGSGTDRTLTLTPAPNRAGFVMVTLTVSDGEAEASSSFTLTVHGVSAPSISAIPDQETNENTPVGPIAFTVDDAQTDPADLLVTATSNNQTVLPDANITFGGSGTDRTLTLTPADNQFGEAMVTVVVEDEDSNQASVSFMLTVHPANTAPVAADDFYSVDTGQVLVVDAASGVLANDTDPEGDPLTALLVDPPAAGDLVFNPDGSFTYTPEEHEEEVTTTAPGEEEEDPIVFTYRATDGATTSNLATVTISVVHVPIIGMIPDQVTRENVPVGPIRFTVQPGNVTVEAVSNNQTVLPNANIVLGGEGRNRTLTLTPGLDQIGIAEVTVVASDLRSEARATFTLTVLPEGAPSISNIPDQVTYENVPVESVPFTVDDDETDPDDLIITMHSDNETLLPHGNMGHGGFGHHRTLSLAPATNQTGTALVTVTVEDEDGYQVFTNFFFRVYEEGVPVAVPDTYEVEEDVPLVVDAANGVLANDYAPEGTMLTAVLEAPPTEGTLLFNADGSFTFTPAPKNLGEYKEDDAIVPGLDAHDGITFTYRATTGSMTSDPATVTITIGHDEIPVLSEIPDQEINEDETLGPVDFTVRPGHAVVTATSSNQALVPDDNIVIVGSGPHGRGRNRTITITPTPDQFGKVVITVTAINEGPPEEDGLRPDEEPLETSITFMLTIHPVNDPPVAENDAFSVPAHIPTTLTVLANDTDIDSNNLTAVIVTQPANGTVEVTDDGSALRYIPTGEFVGMEMFTYRAYDDQMYSNVATVNVEVYRPVVDLALTKRHSDDPVAAGSPFTYLLDVFNIGPDVATGVVVTNTLPAEVTFVEASPDEVCTFEEATHRVTCAFGEMAADDAEPGATLRLTIRVPGVPGTLLNVATVAGNEDDPAPDNNRMEEAITVVTSLVVVATDDIATVNEDGTTAIAVLDNDSAPDRTRLQVRSMSEPTNGTAVLQADGKIVYTPTANFHGSDSFTYEAGDGTTADEGTVQITIKPMNDAPVFMTTPVTTAKMAKAYSYEIVVEDIDADALTLTAKTLPAWLSCTESDDGSWMLAGMPGIDHSGPNEVMLEVDDGNGGVVRQTFTIMVAGNAAPIAGADAAETDEDTAVTIAVLANDEDPDGNTLNVVGVANPEHGTATINEDSSITYVPDLNYFGPDTFTYTLSDGYTTIQGIVTVTMLAVNDAPGDFAIISPEDGTSVAISGDPDEILTIQWDEAIDPDGDEVAYTWQLTLEEDAPEPEVLFSMPVGVEKQVSLDYGTIAAALTAHGVSLNASITLYHCATATDGDLVTASPQVSLTLMRGVITDTEPGTEIPTTFSLEQNYPNPFNPSTIIGYALPEPAFVTLRLYTILGKEVVTLVAQQQTAGRYSVVVDASTLASGMYIYRLEAGTFHSARRMVLVR